MARPRLLDAFSCQGGAGHGYTLAGFDVTAVDIEPQPRNPHPFIQTDAVAYIAEHGNEYDVIHASPPCQAYSITKHSHDNEHPDLLEPTREALISTGRPYVIENVVGAPLIDPVMLCGTEFGLRATDVDGHELALRRHRLFESNVWLMGAGGCLHDQTTIAGTYTGSRHRKPEHRDNPARLGGYVPAPRTVRSALLGGVDWMDDHGMAQCIPPVYAAFIGAQLMEALVTA
jgi:DNA (cytosine-5)-methyltransferase 1